MIERRELRLLSNIILLIAAMLLAGCAAAAHNRRLASFNRLYSSGQYMKSARMELASKGDKKPDPSNLLRLLQAGAALRDARKYNQSTKLFDESESIIKYDNNKLMASNAVSDIESTLVNDAVLDYDATEYDGIMVNTYKALNFWELGKIDLARVEFNRALDRQRRAKEKFAKKIEQLRKKNQ